MIRTCFIPALVTCCLCSGWADPNPDSQVIAGDGGAIAQARASRIANPGSNTLKLDLSLRLDREEYLAGEIAELTFQVKNSTADTLAVLTPFEDRTSALYLYKYDGSAYIPYNDGWNREDDPRGIPEGFITTLAPGETRTRKVRSDSPMLLGDTLRMLTPKGSVPLDPGRYRLTYFYGNEASVEFTVVLPIIKAVIGPVFPRGLSRQAFARDLTQKAYPRFALDLEAKGKHFFILTNEGVSGVTRDNFRQTGRYDHIVPFTRLEESNSPINDLTIELDNENGATVVRWADEQRHWRSTRLPKRGGDEHLDVHDTQ